MIQGLWVGDKLSIMERLSISSYLYHGHPYHLYVYDEVEGVPNGTDLKDANEIIPSDRIFKNKYYDTYAAFSDVFRYKLLLEKGGYWVDSDVVCLKPFDFELDYIFTRVRTIRRLLDRLTTRYHIASWIIKAPAGSKIMDYCYSEAVKHDPEELFWGQIGPRLITAAVNKFGLQEYITPGETFFPIRAGQWRQLINNSVLSWWKWRIASQRSYAVHLYNEMWRRNHINKNDSFPRNSIYERLKRLYLYST